MQLKTEKEKYETFFFTYQKEKKERADFLKYRKELTQWNYVSVHSYRETDTSKNWAIWGKVHLFITSGLSFILHLTIFITQTAILLLLFLRREWWIHLTRQNQSNG